MLRVITGISRRRAARQTQSQLSGKLHQDDDFHRKFSHPFLRTLPPSPLDFPARRPASNARRKALPSFHFSRRALLSPLYFHRKMFAEVYTSVFTFWVCMRINKITPFFRGSDSSFDKFLSLPCSKFNEKYKRTYRVYGETAFCTSLCLYIQFDTDYSKLYIYYIFFMLKNIMRSFL